MPVTNLKDQPAASATAPAASVSDPAAEPTETWPLFTRARVYRGVAYGPGKDIAIPVAAAKHFKFEDALRAPAP